MSEKVIRPGGVINNGYGGEPFPTNAPQIYSAKNTSGSTMRRGSAVTPGVSSSGTMLEVAPLPADGSVFSGLVIGKPPPGGFQVLPPNYTFGLLDGQSGKVQAGGLFEATVAEWNHVKGGSGGLAPGAFYYASQSTPGNITATPPTAGQTIMPVGLALSDTLMLLCGPTSPAIA